MSMVRQKPCAADSTKGNKCRKAVLWMFKLSEMQIYGEFLIAIQER